MISIFIESYANLLWIIGIGSLLFFIIGICFIIVLFNRSSNASLLTIQDKKIPVEKVKITSNDIRAIAGEDELSTQLDLARAYIEVGKKQLAANLLKHIMQQGNNIQQQEAQNLLSLLV